MVKVFRLGVSSFTVLFLSILFAPSLQAQSNKMAEFSVRSGAFERVNTPVSASLEGVPLRLETGSLQLYEITGGEEVPVPSQLEASDPKQLTWVLKGETPPGTVRNYELRVVDSKVQSSSSIQGVEVADTGQSLRIRMGNRPVLKYRYEPKEVPEGVDEIYGRGGYIHPLWSPEGAVLTRIQPPDHYHHYGIWNPWTSTEFRGQEIDFWNLDKGQGTVRSDQVIERTEGEVFGGFEALHNHVDFTGSSDETVALKETWRVKSWNVDSERDVWLIDFTSVLHPATTDTFTIKEYRYQGFSLRATEKWNDETASVLTSRGYDKSNANGTRARWMDVSGVSRAQAGTSGVLFMTNPNNYNYPEELRIWPTGMNDGEENVYVNFNPAQDRDWVLAPGTSHSLKYRMLVYDGELSTEKANRYWRDFAHPPEVEVHSAGLLTGADVLVYTRNGEGYVHENISYGVDMIEELGKEYGFTVTTSDDPGQFTRENLRQYDALIFANTNNEAFTSDAQREALQWYVRQGGGFVGIHSASGSERDWPWFSRLLGGNFERHSPRQDFMAEVVNRAHPSTAFLPDRWEIIDDESYYHTEMSPNINVLLAVDLTTIEDESLGEYPGDTFGDTFPIAWCQEFAGGRQWFTALGHRPAHYEDPQFRQHVLGGIQWVVSGTPLDD
jgi:type 1 glutamine amidotransferase